MSGIFYKLLNMWHITGIDCLHFILLMSRFIAGCCISLWRLCAGIRHRLPYATWQDSPNKNTSKGKDIYRKCSVNLNQDITWGSTQG